MGRYGNVMLINGDTEFADEAAVGEVVRLYVVNTANTRIFNFAIRGARAKLVGGDSGRYERETFHRARCCSRRRSARSSTCCSTPPDRSGWNTAPPITSTTSARSRSPTARPARPPGRSRRCAPTPSSTAEHHSIGHDIERPPDKVLAFYSLMPLLYGGDATPASSYVCPMHPEVTSAEPGICPKCGMKLVAVAVTYACPMHPEVTSAEPGTCPKCGMKLVPRDVPLAPAAQPDQGEEHGGHDHGDGLEWEDLMPEINRASDSGNMIWQLDRPARPGR